jgi:hypothetical protein
VSPLNQLPAAWRSLAQLLRSNGADQAARAIEARADELEVALRNQNAEALTLAEASDESGYSVNHLERLVREGRIPNAGRKHAPRISRRDLPHKPAALPLGLGISTLADARRQAVRAVVASDRGATDDATHR